MHSHSLAVLVPTYTCLHTCDAPELPCGCLTHLITSLPGPNTAAQRHRYTCLHTFPVWCQVGRMDIRLHTCCVPAPRLTARVCLFVHLLCPVIALWQYKCLSRCYLKVPLCARTCIPVDTPVLAQQRLMVAIGMLACMPPMTSTDMSQGCHVVVWVTLFTLVCACCVPTPNLGGMSRPVVVCLSNRIGGIGMSVCMPAVF